MCGNASVPHHGHDSVKGLRAVSLAALLGGLVLVLAGPALADRVVLKTGETFTGTIIEEDATAVVLKSISGTTRIPRSAIKTIEKAEAAPKPTPGKKPEPGEKPTPGEKPAPPKIVPVEVAAAKAADALKQARSALVAGDWVKAGGLLEGLLTLDQNTFKYDDRVRATGALITCYLQIKDAQGAAKAIARRAQLARDPNDKTRLLGAAEALRTLGSVKVGAKTLSRFEEVLEAAMPWKAGQCLEAAKQHARKARRLNERAQLDKAADQVIKALNEANVYMPGFSAQHRQEVLEVLVNNILEAGRAAAAHCKKWRPELTRTHRQSLVTKALAMQWNARAKPYIETRAIGEQAVKNLKAFTIKYKAADLYAQNEAEITQLLADLHDYQYYPKGTYFGYGYGYGYGYGSGYSTRRYKIELVRFSLR